MIFEKFIWFWKFFIFTISSYDVYFATYSRLNVHVVSSGKKIQQFENNPQMKFVRLVYMYFTLTYFASYLNCAASTAKLSLWAGHEKYREMNDVEIHILILQVGLLDEWEFEDHFWIAIFHAESIVSSFFTIRLRY